MCVIIDTNLAHKFTTPPHKDVLPLVHWLTDKLQFAQATIGGELRKELKKAGDVIRRFLMEIDRAGRLYRVPDELVEEETKNVNAILKDNPIPKMNDQHIIALAIVSGARLLASADAASGLHSAFKKRVFLDPPGSIYQNASHQHLLRECPPCKNRK